jgi:hypothetical protein
VRRSKPNLIVVATDNAQSRHAIDAVAVRQGIPTIGAGVYDGGIGGEVYLTRPGAACYGCLAAAMNLEKVPAPKPGNLDYNNLNLDEVRSTCALNLDIEQIALDSGADGPRITAEGCTTDGAAPGSEFYRLQQPWHARAVCAAPACGILSPPTRTELLDVRSPIRCHRQ